MQTYQRSTQLVKNDSRARNSHRKAHQVFARAARCQPWKFGAAATGRKYRILQLRLAQLALVLSRFDYSGDALHIYAGEPAIRKALIAYSQTRPVDEQFSWSRKTVFRYLQKLETAGIMRRGGYSGYGTRRRALCPEALLREPVRRESDTSAPANLTLKNSKANTSRGGSGGDDLNSSGDGPRAEVHARVVLAVEVSPAKINTVRDYENRRADLTHRVALWAQVPTIDIRDFLAKASEQPLPHSDGLIDSQLAARAELRKRGVPSQTNTTRVTDELPQQEIEKLETEIGELELARKQNRTKHGLDATDSWGDADEVALQRAKRQRNRLRRQVVTPMKNTGIGR